MPRPSRDDDDDRDAPQAADLEWAERNDEEEDTVQCAQCGRTLHWSAPRCPACGAWLAEPSMAAERSRRWGWPIVVAVLIAIILVVWHGLR